MFCYCGAGADIIALTVGSVVVACSVADDIVAVVVVWCFYFIGLRPVKVLLVPTVCGFIIRWLY